MKRPVATLVVTLLLAVVSAGCNSNEKSEPEFKRPTGKRVTRIESAITQYLEADRQEWADHGDKFFCEVLVLGVGERGTFDGKEGTPVYSLHDCAEFASEGNMLFNEQGESLAARFIVKDVDTEPVVVAEDQPRDGDQYVRTLKALFPSNLTEVVLADDTLAVLGEETTLECKAQKRAIEHFRLDGPEFADDYDACEPPT